MDKVKKIREEVARIQLYSQSEVLKQVLDYIDEVQEEPVSEDLEEAADKYESEQQEKYKDRDNHDFDCYRDGFVDGLTHTYNAFKAGAQWQKEHLWKPSDGDELPEYEREVVVFTQNFPDDAGIMMVAIGHRPTPEGFDGKSLTTGEVEHYTPKTYDKGGWNIPDVKYWLDCYLPKEIEEL